MRDVIQIFKFAYAIQKADYSSESRSLLNDWPEIIKSSKTGYLESDTLVLPDYLKTNPDLKKNGLIILQDIEGLDQTQFDLEVKHSDLPDWYKQGRDKFTSDKNQQLRCFSEPNSKNNFELFNFNKISQGTFELKLNHDLNQYSIGLPKRSDHVFALLKKDHPIAYRINGKIDDSSGRTFMEYKYVIQFLGTVNSIKFKAPNQISIDKHTLIDKAKHVDERKILK